MKHGEVWWVNFDLLIGGEVKNKRPAVIISNDASNRHLNRVQVVPLTSRTDRVYPSEALVMVDGKQNKAMADQLTTVSKARVLDLEYCLDAADMRKIDRAVKIQLGLRRN